jgi:hypothetical protein
MFIFQFLPKVYHIIHIMRKMQKVTGYIFGSIWWGFGLNLFAYFIASHVSILFLITYRLNRVDMESQSRSHSIIECIESGNH